MNFDQLLGFVKNKMKMSHIYQPLMLKSLVEAGGSATVRQLAHSFLSQDESQLRYYEDRIKRMPLPVLKSRGVVSKDGDLVSLNCRKLTLEQKSQILMLCEQKLREYVLKRGISIWDYRMLERDPIPDSLYYRVLKEAKGRCALCGATNKERSLHVDHILPKSQGGKNEYDNLQVLCDKCNQAKGNKDDTDFRDYPGLETDPKCKFCYEKVKPRIIAEHGAVVAIKDGYPVTKGHTLVIPKRHVAEYFELTDAERRDADSLLKFLQRKITRKDPAITGYNIGVNCGESAGQTIFHLHYHLIPRRDGDTEKPRGGVRGVIPGKRSYGR